MVKPSSLCMGPQAVKAMSSSTKVQRTKKHTRPRFTDLRPGDQLSGSLGSSEGVGKRTISFPRVPGLVLVIAFPFFLSCKHYGSVDLLSSSNTVPGAQEMTSWSGELSRSIPHRISVSFVRAPFS